MNHQKRLIILGSIFAGAVAIAIAFYFLARPGGAGRNPLGNCEPGDITKISIAAGADAVVLERGEKRWNVTTPFQDWADPDAVKRVEDTLTQFAVGSIVSENPAVYDQFELAEGSATRVQVYLKGDEKPKLDLFVGKPVTSPQTAYVRYADKKEVHLARNLMPWLLAREPWTFRLSKAVPIASTTTTSIRITQGAEEFELIRSSQTWLRAGSDQVPNGEAAETLVSIPSSWFALEFPDNVDAAKAGLDKPTLRIHFSGGEPAAIRVGNSVAGANGEGFYAQFEGREAIFVVGKPSIEAAQAAIKKILHP